MYIARNVNVNHGMRHVEQWHGADPCTAIDSHPAHISYEATAPTSRLGLRASRTALATLMAT